MTAGDIEVLVIDIVDPTNPQLLSEYGMTGDSAVSWGLDVRGDKIVLSLIDNSFAWSPLIQPYYGDQGGIRGSAMGKIPFIGWHRSAIGQNPVSFSQSGRETP